MILNKIIRQAGFLLSRFFRQDTPHSLFLFISGDTEIDKNLISLGSLSADRKPVLIIFGSTPFISIPEPFDIPVCLFPKIKKNKLVQAFYSGVIGKWIEASDASVIVGAQDHSFNNIIVHVKKTVKKIIVTKGDSWKNIERNVLSKTDIIVCDSEYQKQKAQKNFANRIDKTYFRGSVFAIHNYRDIPPSFALNPNSPPEALYIYQTGEAQKALIIAETAKRAQNSNLNFQFTFVGDVEEIVSPSQLPNCNFYGKIEDKDTLKGIISHSDILIIPDGGEEIPEYLGESMCLGKPIISLASGPMAEFVEDGVNGFLVPPDKEPKKIAEDLFIALSVIASDNDTLVRMAASSFRKAGELFNKKKYYEKWKKVISK
ncbi:MAG: glycosyltransferase [Chitinophagaceae bacterium]|nr:glycosyltransferase [Chitinophagaceae bacterium]